MADKEYIERENIYTIAKKICDAVHSGEYGGCTLPRSRIMLPHFILDLIDDLPAADVRPVVLCWECKHRFNYPICAYRSDDWFCGYGEKREES